MSRELSLEADDRNGRKPTPPVSSFALPPPVNLRSSGSYSYSMDNEQQRQLTPVTLRKRAGLTQRKVAAALEIREQTVSEWERGISVPRFTASSLKKMMQLYNCTIDELIEAFEGSESTKEPLKKTQNALAALIKRKGMTVAEFAEKVEAEWKEISGRPLSRQAVSAWMNGRTNPQMSPAETIAVIKVLDCTLTELAFALSYKKDSEGT